MIVDLLLRRGQHEIVVRSTVATVESIDEERLIRLWVGRASPNSASWRKEDLQETFEDYYTFTDSVQRIMVKGSGGGRGPSRRPLIINFSRLCQLAQVLR
jgi:hypothetical protein